MSVQDTYKANMDAARAGMIANTEPKTLISRNVETEAGIGFGKPVAQGAADKGVIATAAGTTAIFAITVREHSTNANNPDVFAQYDSARLMTKGVIWVEAVATVAAGDPVHVIVADGTFTNTGGVVIPNARWDTSAGAGELALVRLA